MKPGLLCLAVLLLAAGLPACRTSAPVPPAPRLATIQLIGHPIGATLFIDDLLLLQITNENSPTQFQVKPGPHHVRIEKKKVFSMEHTFQLEEGQTLKLPVP